MKDVYTLFQEASPSLIFVNFMFIGFEVVFKYNFLCQGEIKITLICDNDDQSTKDVFASKLASKLCN